MSEKEINWEKIELDYRAGVKSIRQIAADHEIAESGIRRRAKQYEWIRDLAPKIKAKADDIVRRESVRSDVRTEKRISEKQTIDENAHQQADVRLSQRKDIQRSRSIAMQLFDELEHQVGVANVELLEQLGELMYKPDDKINDLYMKIISLPGRVKSMKDLSDTLKTLIALERQAFGLDDENNKPVDALTALLERVSTGNSSAFKPIADDPEY
ncbi:hypothetical protein ACX1NX_00520 [Acinetobacter sp. ANC 5383]